MNKQSKKVELFVIKHAPLENNLAYLLRAEITKSHVNNHICQHCGVKTSTVTPSFYYVLISPCLVTSRYQVSSEIYGGFFYYWITLKLMESKMAVFDPKEVLERPFWSRNLFLTKAGVPMKHTIYSIFFMFKIQFQTMANYLFSESSMIKDYEKKIVLYPGNIF